MLIGEVCKECGLTKKAVAYYADKGLLRPQNAENGYRIFDREDVLCLKRISVLRGLGLGFTEIGEILSGARALADCEAGLDYEARRLELRRACLQRLSDTGLTEDAVDSAARALDENRLLAEKLRLAFPGGYGTYVRMHFGRFLNEKADSPEKKAAYCRIVDFLDGLEIPPELEIFLEETFRGLDDQKLEKLSEAQEAAVGEGEAYFTEDRREAIGQYLDYTASPEFQQSDLFRMKRALEAFFRSSGFYDVVIPGMEILSRDYRSYKEKLEKLNEQMLSRYPQANNR